MPHDDMLYPPMLPLIAHDAKFVFSTDLEVQQFATNAALVAQLEDALACWLSHITDIYAERLALLEWLDTQHSINLSAVAPRLAQLELVLSFHIHFDRREVLACTRLLQLIPRAAKQLERLWQELAVVKAKHDEVVQTLSFVSQVAVFLDQPWSIADVPDTVGPLFSALRALWVCTPLFGPQHCGRFSAVVAYVVERTEHAVHDAGHNVVDRLIASPSVATAVKQGLVAAQDALVGLQEQFYALQTSLTACGIIGHSTDGQLGIHTVLSDVDDAALFSHGEWQFERLKGLLMCVDVLKQDPNKIGSALTDPLSHLDLMDPSAMDQATFLRHLDELTHEEPPSADAIVERIEQKQQAQLSRGVGQRANAVLAPRVPFDQLCSSLMVVAEFNPPVITIMGGPVSVQFLDNAQYSLPLCCSNTKVGGGASAARGGSHPGGPPPARKASDALFICLGKNVQQLTLRGQYCDEVFISHMMATLLDLLEGEDAWKMTDTLAQCMGGKEVHWMHFRKHRSKKPRRGLAGSRSRSISPVNSPIVGEEVDGVRMRRSSSSVSSSGDEGGRCSPDAGGYRIPPAMVLLEQDQ